MSRYEALDKVWDDIRRCYRCGYCREMIRDLTGTFRPCPVREKLRFEHFCARGRNAIARGLVEGHLTISYGLRDVVYTCLMCGGCQDSCSLIDWAKIDSPRITRAMREEIHKLGMTPRKILNVQKIKATQRKVDAPPTCQMACPIEQDVSSYIGLIAKGQYAAALEVIRQTNPLPSVCGRACTHPCESACRQGEIGHPISIMRLKRFCVDHVANSNVRPISPPNQDGMAVGWPSLAAARPVWRRPIIWYDVVCPSPSLRKNPLPGGMMTHAIPDFTLPTKAVLKDIEAIKALGVEIKTGVEIGKNKKLSELLAEGYAAVLVCVGTWVPVSTAVPGADLDGVWEALDFLHKVKSGVKPNHLGKVIIIGGGKVALDASRTALRLGAEDVSIIYRRTREEMPLEFEDLEAALEEGVCITETSLPTSIVGENGKVRKVVVQKVECIKQDQEGQATVVCVEGSDLEIETDTVILAIGQRPDLAGLSTDITFEINRQGAVVVDADFGTGMPAVFWAGDAINGTSSIVEAMASGRDAAKAILKSLNVPDIPAQTIKTSQGELSTDSGSAFSARTVIPTIDITARQSSFAEVGIRILGKLGRPGSQALPGIRPTAFWGAEAGSISRHIVLRRL